MPEISVVVPVYNVEQYLELCIKSITAQTFSDIEIIIVDDGSTDSSSSICDDFEKKDKRISVIHQENSGLGGARNTGINAATCSYILFVDSDDTINKNLIEVTYQAALENHSDIVRFDILRVDDRGEALGILDSALPKEKPLAFFDNLLLLTDVSACNKLFRRSLFIDNEIFFPKHLWYEDLRTIPKLYCHAKNIYYVDQPPLYYYLIREHSITSNRNPDRTVNERISAVNSVWEYYRENGLISKVEAVLIWMSIFHGFFLPAREIVHYSKNFKEYIIRLKQNLDKLTAAPFKNPYINEFSKKENLMFRLFYKERFFMIKTLNRLNKMRKK